MDINDPMLMGVSGEMLPPALPTDSAAAGGQQSSVDASEDPSSAGTGDDVTPLPHVFVVYMIDPFNCGAHARASVRYARLITLALHKCYLAILCRLPPASQPSVQFETIPLQTLFDCTGGMVDYSKDVRETIVGMQLDMTRPLSTRTTLGRQSAAEALRSLAVCVYTQTRAITLDHIIQTSALTGGVGGGGRAKSLTGMGPSSDRLNLLRSKHVDAPHASRKYYRQACVTFALAPHATPVSIDLSVGGSAPSTVKNATELLTSAPTISPNDGTDRDHLLLVSYCLSDNQRWLLATATNGRGTLLETCMINMHDIVVVDHMNHRVNPDTEMPPGVHERWVQPRDSCNDSTDSSPSTCP